MEVIRVTFKVGLIAKEKQQLMRTIMIVSLMALLFISSREPLWMTILYSLLLAFIFGMNFIRPHGKTYIVDETGIHFRRHDVAYDQLNFVELRDGRIHLHYKTGKIQLLTTSTPHEMFDYIGQYVRTVRY